MHLEWDEYKIQDKSAMPIELPHGAAETICCAVSRIMLQSLKAWKIVGLTIYDSDEHPVETQFGLIPSSTDMSMDVCYTLSTLHYDLKPEIKSIISSSRVDKNVQVFMRDKMRLVAVTVHKQFTPDKPYMTTDDLADVFDIYGMDKPVTLLHVTNTQLTLKLVFFLQEVQGSQTQMDSQLLINHIMDDGSRVDVMTRGASNNKVNQILPASTTGDIRVKYDIQTQPVESFSITLCTVKGDPRKAELEHRFETTLKTVMALYDPKRVVQINF